VLVEKGILDVDAVDAIVAHFEDNLGPMNGAKVVARAWADPEYKARLLSKGTAAMADLGFSGPEGEHMAVVENTSDVHNLVVCTLCSCYPWPTLGLPPKWYKAPAYRARAVREPRKLLAEMGTVIPDDVDIQMWDSSAEARYLVLPMRPDTDDLSEEQLAGVVTRDSMIGVQRLRLPHHSTTSRSPATTANSSSMHRGKPAQWPSPSRWSRDSASPGMLFASDSWPASPRTRTARTTSPGARRSSHWWSTWTSRPPPRSTPRRRRNVPPCSWISVTPAVASPTHPVDLDKGADGEAGGAQAGAAGQAIGKPSAR
jgi:nitrile hydratase subunit alpha